MANALLLPKGGTILVSGSGNLTLTPEGGDYYDLVASVTISPLSIPSTDSLGSPTLVVDTILTMVGIAPTASFGTPEIAQGFTVVGIPPSVAIGTPTLDVDFTVVGIASTATVGAPGTGLGGTLGTGVFSIQRPPDIPLDYPRGEPPPADVDPILLRFLMQELTKLQSAVKDLQWRMPQEAIEAPQRPPHQLIRYARQPWDPLGTAPVDAGWVYWNGTAWVALP